MGRIVCWRVVMGNTAEAVSLPKSDSDGRTNTPKSGRRGRCIGYYRRQPHFTKAITPRLFAPDGRLGPGAHASGLPPPRPGSSIAP